MARGLRRRQDDDDRRRALGATRPRPDRRFLTEGFILTICGGALGLLLSVWICSRLLVRMLPARQPDFRVRARGCLGEVPLPRLGSPYLHTASPVRDYSRCEGDMYALGLSLGSRAISQGNRWRHGMLALEAALSVPVVQRRTHRSDLLNLLVTPTGFDGANVT